MKCKKCGFVAPVIDMSGNVDNPEFITDSETQYIIVNGKVISFKEPILKCPNCGEIQ